MWARPLLQIAQRKQTCIFGWLRWVSMWTRGVERSLVLFHKIHKFISFHISSVSLRLSRNEVHYPETFIQNLYARRQWRIDRSCPNTCALCIDSIAGKVSYLFFSIRHVCSFTSKTTKQNDDETTITRSVSIIEHASELVSNSRAHSNYTFPMASSMAL